MPQERLSMRKVREILRLRAQGLSHRAIGASCGLGAGTVCDYLGRLRSAGLSWPLPDGLTDDELDRRLFPPSPPSGTARPMPDWNSVTHELRRKGVTLLLLWEEYHAQHPTGYGYSRYCDLYREFARVSDPRMRQVHKAGEKLFVDYAGQTMPVVDPSTGEIRQTQIFVATLGASDHTFAEATWSQALEDWIGSHVRAFEYFGGVPEIVVPDNLKSGVKSPCHYEPDLNPTYLEMAQHYGVAIIPARVRKPRDKAKVENHVLAVERRVLAPLRDRRFLSLAELNDAIAERLDELSDRPFQKMAATRRQLFEQIDAPALRPLPDNLYVFARWTRARVSIDYHIAVEQAYYSVPYTLIKKQVDVRITTRIVEILHDGKRVASHPRSFRAGNYSTVAEHMPKAHQAYVQWEPHRLIRWAAETGPFTAKLVAQILERFVHPQQGYRSCLGLIRLDKVYGPQRLEAACAKALAAGAISYRSVHSILRNKLDTLPQDEEQMALPLPEHPNIRGANYYA
jgi:transposase